ncbi:hypothetical protein J7E81_28370 [Bacillus sp. ISL-18]|uniref:hypothetical protein n=1 Tax=Bacillus sp. ISL-18 TaxID=2819118 RepID=UPI001BEA54EC|nr:hypothetical protein [Bacillus sp. ISL-18]MBT2659092.1 hypothetical protein [Bacillus sp. ISL-18]
MKISIEEISKELGEEILIRCHEVDDEIYEIVNKLKTENLILLGYQHDRVHRIKPLIPITVLKLKMNSSLNFLTMN